MLSSLTRGYGSWSGDYDPNRNEAEVESVTDLYTADSHRHGITVYPSPRTAPPQSPRVERPDGQLDLPKTYLTRKGALLLFSSLQDAEKTEVTSPRRLRRSSNLIDLSLRIGTLDRLSKSILQFGDEEYDREKSSISESENKLFMKFLRTLDSDQAESDVHSQPGGDLRFYLRDLRSRASSRGYGRDSAGGYRSQELREILRELEGVWPPQSTGASDHGLHGDFFHLSGSETSSPRSRILSSRKLASSLKSSTYLGRPTSAVSDASVGRVRMRDEEEYQGLGRVSLRRSRRTQSAYWTDSTPAEQPATRSRPLPTPVEDQPVSVPDVSSEGTGTAVYEHLSEPSHQRTRSSEADGESVASSIVEEEEIDLPSDLEEGEEEKTAPDESWPQPVTMVMTERKSSELSFKQDMLPLSRPGSGRPASEGKVYTHLGPGFAQPLQPQYKQGLLLLQGEGTTDQEVQVSSPRSSKGHRSPLEEPSVPRSPRPPSASLVRTGSRHSVRSVASPRPSLTGRVASPSLSEAVASSKGASHSGSRPSSHHSQSSTTAQTVISVQVTREKAGSPEEVAKAQSVVSSSTSEPSQRPAPAESSSQGTLPPASVSGSVASLPPDQDMGPETMMALHRESDAESETSRKNLPESQEKTAVPQPEVIKAHVEKVPSEPEATQAPAIREELQPEAPLPGPPTVSSSSSPTPTPTVDLTKPSDGGSEGQVAREVAEAEALVHTPPEAIEPPAASVPEKTASPPPPSLPPPPQVETKAEEKAPVHIPTPPTGPKPAVASPRKPVVKKEDKRPRAKSYVKAMDIKGVDKKETKEESKQKASKKDKERDKWSSYVPPKPQKVVVKEEKELVIPDHMKAAFDRNDALSAQQIEDEIMQKRLEIEASLAAPTLEVDEGEGLTEEELKMAQEALQTRLKEASENLDKPSPRTPRPETKSELTPRKGKKSQKTVAPSDPQSNRTKEREAIREQRKQEKLRRVQEAQELQEKIKAKELERKKKEEEAARQQIELEENMRMLEREADEIREAEEQARISMEATRKVAREEREARRKADLERRKQMALARREKERQMAEAARQKEQEMLDRIADAEVKRRHREEEQLRMEEEERLAQEQFEEEMRAAQLAAEEDERRMQELERQAEEEAMQRLVDEREQAEYQRRMLHEEAERMKVLEEQRRQQMLLEEQRLAEERQRREEEELKRREEEKQRLLELQRLEEETRQQLRQELEKRREEAMRRREKNLDRRDNLDKLQQGQAFTKPWVFSYFVHWPRETYLQPIGGDDSQKKGGKKGAKKKK